MFEFSSHLEFNRYALMREVLHGVEHALRPFQLALDGFLAQLFQGVLPSNWRDEWQAFIVEQQTRGFTVDPKSAEELEEWIEAWAKDCGLWP